MRKSDTASMQCIELRQINLEEWMRGCKKVILQHGTRPYLLTITRRGKLILTAADLAANESEKKLKSID